MIGLEEYKVPQSIIEKQKEALEKIRPQLERHYQTRTIQQSGPSLNDK